MATQCAPSASSRRSVFDAIADPTRRAILDGLARGPRAAGDIARDFTIARPSVRKHLRVLEDAGLVRVSADGRMRFYEMDPTPLLEIDRWLERHRTSLAARLVAIKRAAESAPSQGDQS